MDRQSGGFSIVVSDKASLEKQGYRVDPDGPADGNKLNDIKPPLSSFEFRYERLRLSQFLSQVRLKDLPILAGCDQGVQRLLIFLAVRRFHGPALSKGYWPVAHNPTWDILFSDIAAIRLGTKMRIEKSGDACQNLGG